MKTTYSKAIEAKANCFLSEYNLTLDQLTEPQRQFVLRFINTKRHLRWAGPFYVLLICFLCYATYFYYTKALEHKEIALSFITADMESCIDHILNFGIQTGVAFYCGFTCILFSLSLFGSVKLQKRTLDAFLPPIKSTQHDQTV